MADIKATIEPTPSLFSHATIFTNNKGMYLSKHLISTDCKVDKPADHEEHWTDWDSDVDTVGLAVLSKLDLGEQANQRICLVTIQIKNRECPFFKNDIRIRQTCQKPRYVVFTIMADFRYQRLFQNELIEQILKIEHTHKLSKLEFRTDDSSMIKRLSEIFNSHDISKCDRIEEININSSNQESKITEQKVSKLFSEFNDARTSITEDRCALINSLICNSLNNKSTQSSLLSAIQNTQQSSNEKVQNSMYFSDSFIEDDRKTDRCTQIGLRPRRCSSPYWNRNRYNEESNINIMTAATVVFNKSMTRVALTKEAREPYTGKYYLPAGKQVVGESITMLAKREIKEEIGLDISSDSLKLLNIEDNGNKFINFNFLTIVEDNISLKLTKDKHSLGGAWYSTSDILNLTKSIKSKKRLTSREKSRAKTFRYCDIFDTIELAFKIANKKMQIPCRTFNKISYEFNSVRLSIIAKVNNDDQYFLTSRTAPRLLPEIIIPCSVDRISDAVSNFIFQIFGFIVLDVFSSSSKMVMSQSIIGIHHSGRGDLNGVRFDVQCCFSVDNLPAVKKTVNYEVNSDNLTWERTEPEKQPNWSSVEIDSDKLIHAPNFLNKSHKKYLFRSFILET